MKVYHGTGRDKLDGILKEGPRRERRAYLHGLAGFSTTTSFEIAALFALRRSPPEILHGDEEHAGVVLEFSMNRRRGGWLHAKCSGVLQDEKEIAILRDGVVRLRAIWRLVSGQWERHSAQTI